jgi:hypothetical protein
MLQASERRVVVGLALHHAYYTSPETATELRPLWENPDPNNVERVSRELLGSTDPEIRAIGLMLEQALDKALRDPDPIQWRDLALDMCESHVNLIDYMYRMGEFMHDEEDTEKKEMLKQIYDGFQGWQASIGEAIGNLRAASWTEAKIEIEKAYSLSQSAIFDSLVSLYSNFKGAIDIQRRDTGKYRDTIRSYSSKLPLPTDRIAIIVRVQELLLGLQELRSQNEKDMKVSDATSYPIEKLGTAVEYLLNKNVELARANYEIGISNDHLKPRIKTIAGPVGRKLSNITDKLDILFSELPAKPWPVPGFGAPGVESRFKDDDTEKT